MTHDASDIGHMQTALRLARRGLGNVAPNPAVGCVIVGRDGCVAGRGWTQSGGRPHAETEALRRAGVSARGATAFVTLEPCAHHGQTPPCTEALITAGVSRVVVGAEDPDPRVSGAGLRRLKSAGVAVSTGVCAEEADRLNEGFFRRVRDGRPLVTLKLATTLDGRTATQRGESQWITGEIARAHGHLLRARNDAIMIGIGTALSDNPLLTCRLPGLSGRTALRVLVDGRLRLPLTSRLVATVKEAPLVVLTRGDTPQVRRQAFVSAGVKLLDVPVDATGEMDLGAGLHVLGQMGMTRLLVEGGARLAASLIRAELVDRLAWYRAGRLIGGDGLAAIAALGLDKLDDTPAFTLLTRRQLGEDILETYARRR